MSRIKRKPKQIPIELIKVAAEMLRGDFTPSTEAILLTRCAKTGILTVCRWGKRTGLLQEAYVNSLDKADKKKGKK